MRHVFFSLFLVLLAGPVLAAQTLSVKPDGTVTFRASTQGITRLSITGDRIRRIVNEGSAFEMVNDEETGDVFLRFAGEGAPERETGFIISESGVTIHYVLRAANSEAETVVIKVKSGKPEAIGSDMQVGSVGAGSTATDGHAAGIASFLREVISERIGRRVPPNARSGSTFATETSGAMRARILVAKAGKAGGVIAPQAYYTSRTLAVWIDETRLGPNERSWVIVVEKIR